MSSLVSNNNSTTLNLSVGQSFVGAFEPILEYSQISVLTILGANQRATLTISYSPNENGSNAISKSTIVGPNDSYEHIFEVVSKYYRVVVSADKGTAVTGSLHTINHLHKTKTVSVFLNEPITNSHSCEISRAVLTGATLGGQYKNVNLETVGEDASALTVSISKPLGAFGELKTVSSTPFVQVTGTYNTLNPQVLTTYAYDPLGDPFTKVFSENTTLTVQASSNASAYAILKTKKQCVYRAGQGLSFRLAGFFPSGGGSNTVQLAGYGNRGNGLYFGYSNLDFGIMFRTRGRAPIYTATVTNAATSAGNLTITLNNVPYTVPVTAAGGNTAFTAYELAKYTYSSNNNVLWTSEAIGNTVHYTYYSAQKLSGSSNFSAGGTGVVITNNLPTLVSPGANIEETFYPRTQWNVDRMDGTGPSGTIIDPKRGNVYSIQMQWLGYGRLAFSMEDKNGSLQSVHHIEYANTNQVPSLELPHGGITMIAETLGPTTIQPTVKFSSMSAAIEGHIQRQPPLYSASSTKAVTTTELNILALKVRSNYNLFSTVAELFFHSVSFAVDSGQSSVVFRAYLNPVLNPTATTAAFPSFQYVNESNSVALYDLTSTTVSGGSLVYQVTIVKDSSYQLVGDALNSMYVGKDDIIVFTAKGNNNTVSVSAVWFEEK